MSQLPLAFSLLLQAAGAASVASPAAAVLAPAATSSEERPARGILPSSQEVRQALGERQKALQEEKERLREEERRLEQLRQEIRQDIQAQARLLSAPDESQAPAATPPGQQAIQKMESQVEDRQARVRRVSRGLASMTPATAALALSRLSVPFAAELLSVMDAKRVGKILDAMSPEQAARVVEALVARGAKGGAP
ncbi:MAG: hypothetical protein GYA21_02490 [Myxococcales bacterium]|nr:hypothetical protein [Myxococcales bacterium]